MNIQSKSQNELNRVFRKNSRNSGKNLLMEITFIGVNRKSIRNTPTMGEFHQVCVARY